MCKLSKRAMHWCVWNTFAAAISELNSVGYQYFCFLFIFVRYDYAAIDIALSRVWMCIGDWCQSNFGTCMQMCLRTRACNWVWLWACIRAHKFNSSMSDKFAHTFRTGDDILNIYYIYLYEQLFMKSYGWLS